MEYLALFRNTTTSPIQHLIEIEPLYSTIINKTIFIPLNRRII